MQVHDYNQSTIPVPGTIAICKHLKLMQINSEINGLAFLITTRFAIQ